MFVSTEIASGTLLLLAQLMPMTTVLVLVCATTASSSKAHHVSRALLARPTLSATLRVTASAMRDSLTTKEYAHVAHLVPSGAPQLLAASMFAVKTQPSLPTLVAVCVTLASG